MWRLIILPVFSLILVSKASALSNSVESTVGYSLPTASNDFSSRYDLQLDVNLEDSFEDIYWVANARYTNDSLGSSAAEEKRESDFEWRDLYVGGTVLNWDVALGWQQVVWGGADELRVTDLVNPEGYREFILPNLNARRMAIPMLKLNRYVSLGKLEDWEIELLYIPVFKENEQAERGSEFSILDKDTGLQYLPVRQFDKEDTRAEYGLKFSGQLARADISFMALQSYDDNPVYTLDVSTTNEMVLQESHQRFDMLGMALSFPIGGHVIRFESAHLTGFSYMRAEQGISLSEKNTTNLLVGWDYLIKDWMLSMQANDRIIHDWKADLFLPEREPLLTASLQGNTLNGKLETRISYAHYLENNNGSIFQVQSSYRFNSKLLFGIALDVLSGNQTGLIGQFSESDRIKLNIGYEF